MAAAPVPAPTGDDGSTGNGPGPGGGFPSPAQAQSDPRAAQLLQQLLGVVSVMRAVGSQVPAATSEVRQINDLISQVIGKVKGSGPSPQTQAPPV